jgi:hypothetical protein
MDFSTVAGLLTVAGLIGAYAGALASGVALGVVAVALTLVYGRK